MKTVAVLARLFALATVAARARVAARVFEMIVCMPNLRCVAAG
jgi:hypothetical protein